MAICIGCGEADNSPPELRVCERCLNEVQRLQNCNSEPKSVVEIAQAIRLADQKRVFQDLLKGEYHA
jgi:hypothetical protein